MFGDVRLDAREPIEQFMLDKPLGCERLSGGQWLKPELVKHACLAFAQSAFGIEEPLHERAAGLLVVDEVVNQEIGGLWSSGR